MILPYSTEYRHVTKGEATRYQLRLRLGVEPNLYYDNARPTLRKVGNVKNGFGFREFGTFDNLQMAINALGAEASMGDLVVLAS